MSFDPCLHSFCFLPVSSLLMRSLNGSGFERIHANLRQKSCLGILVKMVGIARVEDCAKLPLILAKNSGICQEKTVRVSSMDVYKAKAGKLGGTDFYEVRAAAMLIFKKIKKKSRRQPYLRSVYFKKDKVFLNLFWHHLFDKDNWRDRMRRLQYFEAALELIERTRFEPQSKYNPNKGNEILHRFIGVTKEGDLFFVQIKENLRNKKKFLMSIFPGP